MAEIVNLRTVRRRKARAAREAAAEVNRVAFGRTRHERDLQAAREQADSARLDGHLRPAETGRSDT